MTEEKEGINSLLAELLKFYGEENLSGFVVARTDNGKEFNICLKDLSGFFDEGRINWSFIISRMDQMQEDIAFGRFSIDKYVALFVLEKLLVRAGIILPHNLSLKDDGYLSLRSNNWERFRGVCNNKDEFLFARKEDMLAFAQGWIKIRKLEKSSDLRFFSKEIEDIKVVDFPEGSHVGVDWLKEEKFPSCQN